MTNANSSGTGADWTQLLADPELASHLGELLQSYRDAPPDKRDEALLAAMRRIKKIYEQHGFRHESGEGGLGFGLDHYPKAFYATWRYKKAGTDDFRAAMEKAGGRSLERFFDGWIFGSAIPTVRFTVLENTGRELRVRFDRAIIAELIAKAPADTPVGSYAAGATSSNQTTPAICRCCARLKARRSAVTSGISSACASAT